MSLSLVGRRFFYRNNNLRGSVIIVPGTDFLWPYKVTGKTGFKLFKRWIKQRDESLVYRIYNLEVFMDHKGVVWEIFHKPGVRGYFKRRNNLDQELFVRSYLDCVDGNFTFVGRSYCIKPSVAVMEEND